MPDVVRCTHSIFMEGPYDETYMPFCVRCNHEYKHIAVVKEGVTYAHECGEWVEIWDSKFAKCAHPVAHKGPCIGEVVTQHRPRKDYTAYVNSNSGAA